MKAGVFVRWNARKIRKEMDNAVKLAIDQTTAACVMHAKVNHPWTNRTRNLEGSIQMRAAKGKGDMITGTWGSIGLAARTENSGYNWYLELGTQNMPAMPYLRPAAAAEYPNLPGRIKKARG